MVDNKLGKVAAGFVLFLLVLGLVWAIWNVFTESAGYLIFVLFFGLFVGVFGYGFKNFDRLRAKQDAESIKGRKKDRVILSYTGSKELGIEYVDASGNRSEREITVDYLYYENDLLYVRAFCHLRNEERTFRVDKIVRVSLFGADMGDPEEYFYGKVKGFEK